MIDGIIEHLQGLGKVNITGIDNLTSVVKLLRSAGYITEFSGDGDELKLVENLVLKYQIVEESFNDKRLRNVDGIMNLFYDSLYNDIDFEDDFTLQVIREAYDILAGGEG